MHHRRRDQASSNSRTDLRLSLLGSESSEPTTSVAVSSFSSIQDAECSERLHEPANQDETLPKQQERWIKIGKSGQQRKWIMSVAAGALVMFGLVLLALLVMKGVKWGDDELERWPEAAELRKRHLRSVYSDVQASDGQIWLINLHEIRRRRHLSGTLATDSFSSRSAENSTKSTTSRNQRLFGLARSCGQRCAFKLRHEQPDGRMTQFEVHFRRRRFNSYKSNGQERSYASLIQYMDSDDQARAQTSRISPDCIYEARVADSENFGMVNLCEPNGGLFGTLALPDGAFIIEPLISDDELLANEESSTLKENSSDNDLKQNGNRRRRSVTSNGQQPQSLRLLRPHLIYSPRSQQFEQPLNNRRQSNSELIREEDGDGDVFVKDTSTSEEDDQENEEMSAEAEDSLSRDEPELEQAFAFDGMNFSRFDAHTNRKKRAANSWDYYVEVLVVADYKMLVYHQNNLENYVLTLFSTVASIYRHASIQASVNIIVVRIVILKSENAGLRITNRAQETLQQFCAWQQTYNDRNDDSIAHHDVAILLTRHDICRATNKCDTLGLAELGTMCDARKSCAIIEDNGLSAAFTIAHELGHIFNIPHDDERRCGQFMPLNKNSYHIMAPTLEFNTNPWAWSPCSAAMINKFLDSKRSQAQCILDQPVERKYFDKMFNFPEAGMMYSVNRQCQFVFGASAEICPYMPTCRRLWCSTYYGFQMGCRTQHMPWADGTPCGANSWCHRGQCVGIPPDQRPKIDGAWGDWQPFGACSRSCGGGVQKGVRECDNPTPQNGGKYCVGQRERYRSCNTHECPYDSIGFRELQCEEFNDRDVGIHGIPRATKWLPKYSGIAENERCRLYCRAHDSAAFYLLKEKVLDGTPCARNVDDICIDGTCHQAGCDHRLGSPMRRDSCGVCGGDGSTCETVQGTYNERGSFGYNEILKIPAGSANIDISQNSHNSLKEDDNYLALRTSTGEFLLNGQYQVSVFRQQIPIQDTVLEYSGSDHTIERINGTGPLRADIYVHVLSVGNLNPPHVRYKYMLPKPQERTGARPPNQIRLQAQNYYWSFAESWSACSQKCQGTQTQVAVCMDAVSTRPVMDDYCMASKRPDPNKRMCNVDCFVKWRSTPASGCSTRCGRGEQQQQNTCVRSYTSTTSNGVAAPKPDEQANEQECLAAGLAKPPERVPCFTDCFGRKWSYSNWGQCSSSCGSTGLIRRQASCVDGANRRLDERHCAQIPKESIESECNRIPCPQWSYTAWSECSQSCNGGIKVRHAQCQDQAGRDLPARMCSGQKLDREACNTQKCKAQWKFGPWGECSTTCGIGVETRDAKCVEQDGTQSPDTRCAQNEKILRRQCRRIDCPAWKVGSWSACSVSCLEGYRQRSVQCVEANGRSTSDQHCLKLGPRPPSHEQCNQGPCPFWRIGQWSRCSITCGDGGIRERKVECVHKDQVVDASLCSTESQPQPPAKEQCKLLECAQWDISEWNQCSANCGVGIQKRNVECKRGAERLPDRDCSGSTKPKTERQCERRSCSNSQTPQPTQQRQERPTVYWATGAWTDCSRSCDGGIQRRAVQCHGHNRVLPVEYCKWLEKEPDTRDCNTKPCTQWLASEWIPCQATCGTQMLQQRQVKCVSIDRNLPANVQAQITNSDCDPTQQPPSTRSCNLPQCPREPKLVYGDWQIGEWSECSVTCGIGYKRRSVFCSRTLCREHQKPVQFEHCNLGECKRKTSWQASPWSHCSVSCGSDGVQMRTVWCKDDSLPLKVLADSECDRHDRPISRRGCASINCTSTAPQTTTPLSIQNGRQSNQLQTPASDPKWRYAWTSGEWSTCSASCGPGLRKRPIKCIDGNNNKQVSDHLCLKDSRPVGEQRCRQAHCARWHKEIWSTCSKSCGSGVKRRKVYCRRGRQKVQDQECSLSDRPEDLKPCEQRRCPSYRWQTTMWSKCADPCKAGEQFRRTYCMSDDKKRAAPRMCQNSTEPSTKRPCPLQNCPYHWVASPWSTCSKSCGVGRHFRKIECKVKSKMMTAKIDKASKLKELAAEPTVLSRMCIALEKPSVSEQCQMNPCNSTYQWEVGAWSSCSASCGGGFRRRRIKCMHVAKAERADRSKCDRQFKPPRRESCFVRNCLPNDCAELKAQSESTRNVDGNYTVLVAGYRVQVYCHQMNETLPKTYINVDSKENYAEFYGKRLLYPHTCPQNGQRNDSCECTDDGHASAGRTEFMKLRVDLHNMKINPHDYTFARTLYGNPVALGTAGDCFSMSDCPQGKFSIDLRLTGVRLVEDLQWKDHGHRTSSRIERKHNNAVIQGQCGGYCGECAPDKFKGLVIEVDHKQKPAVGAG